MALGTGAFLYLGKHPPGPHSFYPGCILKKTTGIDCVGCGMTRATYLLANGRILDALRMNVIGVIFLPFLALTGAYGLMAWCRDRPLPNWRLPKWAPWTIFGIFMTFGVLRNIPHHPFSLLAPIKLEP